MASRTDVAVGSSERLLLASFGLLGKCELCGATKGACPLHPNLMEPAKHLDEVAKILAAGLVRLKPQSAG